MNPIEHLQAVRKIIEKPENWTQGTFARDRQGNSVDFDDLTELIKLNQQEPK